MATKKSTAKKAKPTGRQPLDKRYMIRCASNDWALWDALAQDRGFNGAGPLIRKTMDDLLKDLDPSKRKEIESRASEILKAAA